MAATIRVRLRNETAEGIRSIRTDMQDTADVAVNLGDTMAASAQDAGGELARLHAQHELQIKVIHEHQASWSQLTAAVVPAVASIAAGTLRYAGTLATLAAQQKALETVLAPLASSQRAINIALNLGEKAAIRGAAQLAGYGAAAGGAAAMLGGATATIKGYETVLSHTGVTTQQLTTATDDQKRAFAELKAEAESTGESIETVAKKMGVSLDSLGAVTKTNLDRLSSAAGETGSELNRLAEAEGKVLTDAAYHASGLKTQLDMIKTVWNEIDAAATRSTSQAIENLGHVRTAAIKAYDALNGDGASQRLQDMEHLEAARKREVDDFARLRGVESELGRLQQQRAEQQRMDSLKTLGQIDGEIARQKELAGIAASNNKFDQEAAQRLRATLEALGSKRAQIEGEWAKEARTSILLTQQMQQASERRQTSQIEGIDDSIRKAREHAEARRKGGVTDGDAAKAQAEADRLAKTDGADPAAVKAAQQRATMLANSTNNAKDIEIELSDTLRELEARKTEVVRSETEKRKELAEQYRKFQKEQADASEAESSRLMHERNQKILSDQKEAEKQAQKALDERLKQIDEEVDARWKAEQQRVQAAQKAQAEIDRMRTEAAKKAQDERKKEVDAIAELLGKKPDMPGSPNSGNGRQGGQAGPSGTQGANAIDFMRSRIRPQDIAKSIGSKRSEEAMREFDKTKEDRKLALSDSGMLRDDIEAKLRSERKRAGKQAFTQGYQDTVRGRGPAGERAAAENELIQAQIGSAQKTGQLSDIVAQGLSQAARAAIDADAKAEQAMAIARQVQNALTAAGQRSRATNGSLRG